VVTTTCVLEHPAVEPHGLSAFDITQVFVLATDVDKQLVPFSILPGQAETDVAKRMFHKFLGAARDLFSYDRSRCSAEAGGAGSQKVALDCRARRDGFPPPP
jgi:hypothetical protein